MFYIWKSSKPFRPIHLITVLDVSSSRTMRWYRQTNSGLIVFAQRHWPGKRFYPEKCLALMGPFCGSGSNWKVFNVYVYYNKLCWISSLKDSNSRAGFGSLHYSRFQFKVVYWGVSKQQAADSLSSLETTGIGTDQTRVCKLMMISQNFASSLPPFFRNKAEVLDRYTYEKHVLVDK